MKECRACFYCARHHGHLACINKSSDNCGKYIEKITECELAMWAIIGDGDDQSGCFDFAALKMTAIPSTIQCTTRIGSMNALKK